VSLATVVSVTDTGAAGKGEMPLIMKG
jgi:hypothetical protein